MKVLLIFIIIPILTINTQDLYRIALYNQNADKCVILASRSVNSSSPLKVSKFRSNLLRSYYGIMNLLASDLEIMKKILMKSYEPFTERLRQILCDLHLNMSEDLDEDFFHLLPDHIGMQIDVTAEMFMKLLNFESYEKLTIFNQGEIISKFSEDLIETSLKNPPKYLLIHAIGKFRFSDKFQNLTKNHLNYGLIGFSSTNGEVVSNNRLYRSEISYPMDFKKDLDIEIIDLMLNRDAENIFLYKLKSSDGENNSSKLSKKIYDFLDIDSLKRGAKDVVEDVEKVFEKLFG